MAIKDNNIPTIIGRSQSARRNVRYISTGEGEALQRAGEGAQRMGGMILQGMNAYAQYLDERNSAAFAKGYAEAEAEAARRVHDEVRTRSGFDAEGAAQKTEEIYREVGEKYRPQMRGQYRDRFDAAWGRLSGSQYRVSSDFEIRNLRHAAKGATAASIKSNIERAADSMDEEYQSQNFSSLRENYDRLFLFQNGGKRIPTEVLADLDKDAEKGTIRTRDGKTLRVTEGEEGEGTISKARVKEIRAKWKVRADAYEKGLTDSFDLAHANVIDRLLKDDRTVEAEMYMGFIAEKNYPISEKTRSKLRMYINNAEKVIQDNALAASAVDKAIDAGGELRYGSLEQDAAFADNCRELADKPEVLAQAKRLYTQRKQVQTAMLQADAVQFTKDNFFSEDANGRRVAKGLPERKLLVEKMAPGPLKDYFVQALAKEEEALSKKNQSDPVYQLRSARNLSVFKEAVRQGYYDVIGKDGKTVMRFGIQNNEQAAVILNGLGLLPDDKKRASQYLVDRENSVSLQEVREVFYDIIKRAPTQKDADQYIPMIQKVMEDRRAKGTFSSKSERTKWLKENMLQFLSLEAEHLDGFWGDPNGSLQKKFTDNIDLNTVYFYGDRYTKFVEGQSAARAVRGAKPRTTEETDFANRNVVRSGEKGYFYFLNPQNKGRK